MYKLLFVKFWILENESDIPVINNSDIIPVLVVVLIRSKLVHLASNLFYIECFLWAVKDEEKYGYGY